MQEYRIKLTFIEPLLGTVPKDKDAYASYPAADQDEDVLKEELETVPEQENIKGITGFHTDEEGMFLYDYVFKGFCKDACGMMRRVPKSESSKIRAYKKIIDGLVFVKSRRIYLQLPDDYTPEILARPLRAQTAQGERVAIARSDVVPPGTVIEFILQVLGQVTPKILTEWLNYGRLRGLGQWRNAGYGAFEYEMTILEG